MRKIILLMMVVSTVIFADWENIEIVDYFGDKTGEVVASGGGSGHGETSGNSNIPLKVNIRDTKKKIYIRFFEDSTSQTLRLSNNHDEVFYMDTKNNNGIRETFIVHSGIGGWNYISDNDTKRFREYLRKSGKIQAFIKGEGYNKYYFNFSGKDYIKTSKNIK
jgi:hypothetical protein